MMNKPNDMLYDLIVRHLADRVAFLSPCFMSQLLLFPGDIARANTPFKVEYMLRASIGNTTYFADNQVYFRELINLSYRLNFLLIKKQ